MHIGITGPISLGSLREFLPSATALPKTLSFPLIGRLSRELLLRGCRLDIFAGSYEISEPCRFHGISGVPLEIYIVPLRKKRGSYDFYRKERQILSPLIQQSSCQFVHAHWTYEFAAAALDSGKPCLITAHDSPLAILNFFLWQRAMVFWLFRVLLGTQVIRKARWLTTVSPYCQEHISRTLKPEADFRVVPNAVPPEILSLGNMRLAAGEPNPPLKVAVVSEGFTDRKNSKTAIRAFHMVRKQLPTAELHFFGTGHEPAGVAEQWATKYHLHEGVVFHGKVENDLLLTTLAGNFHCLLHPSLEESFGMAPLEAMALGIPVIGGVDSGAVPWVVGEAGLLVDLKSEVQISQALLQILGDQNLRNQLARKGHLRASKEFSLEKMVSEYEVCYRRVFSNHLNQ